jgi:hypothetical protein
MKVERIDKEIVRTEEKIGEYQNRLRELQKQKTEAENLEIIALVRGVGISHAELPAVLSALRRGKGIPAALPGPGSVAADESGDEPEK